MNRIVVQSPGLLTTVQDLGRAGFGPMGVSSSGAADPVALRLGNLLVGNPEGAAALEMTMTGGTFLFPEGATVALAGADFGARAGGAPVEPWTTRVLPPGARLETGVPSRGARCYLCIRGGIEVPLVLGSASTHLLCGLGGFEGRQLRKGDVLHAGEAAGNAPLRALRPSVIARLAPRTHFRVTAAPQTGWFSEEQRRSFAASPYRVSEQSNRMGLRLHGPAVTPSPQRAMLTEGVSLGAIQAPPDGQPIILFVEQQTTGGYPKIANVIAADLAALGRLRPGDAIWFEWVSPETTRALLLEQERALRPEELFL